MHKFRSPACIPNKVASTSFPSADCWSQIIRWLHDEALIVGMKVSRDFLCLYFDLDQGDMLGLVARVDPETMSMVTSHGG